MDKSTNFLNMGNIIPIGIGDIESSDPDDNKSAAPGQFSIIRDAFGERMLRYMRCQQVGGHLKGEAARRRTASNTTLSTGGTLASNRIYGAFNSAGKFKGAMCIHTNNTSTVGAAPEGEVAIIASNTASCAFLDPQAGFTATPNAGDTVSMYSVFGVEDASFGDAAALGAGIACGDITVNEWGWYQCKGIFPNAKISSKVSAGMALYAGSTAGTLHASHGTVSGAGNADNIWGRSIATIQGDVSGMKAPVFINVLDAIYDDRD